MNGIRPNQHIQQQILPYLPKSLREGLERLGTDTLSQLQEIRLRSEKPVALVIHGQSSYLGADGSLTRAPELALITSGDDFRRTLNAITENSLYALDEELRRGYVTLPGGHRVGLAGRVILERGAVYRMKDFSGLAIRIARELPGCARSLIPRLVDPEGNLMNTLLISPPGCGKTTILRDLARSFSYGWPDRSRTVSIVDERSEIAGSYEGKPQLDVGPCTDVLDACPKAQGILMAVRALSPEIVVVDEIGGPEDAAAVFESINAGVQLIATAHAATLDEVLRRPVLKELTARGAFQALVVLSRRNGPGTLEEVAYSVPWGGEGYDLQTGWRRVDCRRGRVERPQQGQPAGSANSRPAQAKIGPQLPGKGDRLRAQPAAASPAKHRTGD